MQPRLFAIALFIVPVTPVAADTPFAGPVDATVVRVVDGDTVKVDAHIWPGQTLRVAVRLRGVDTPELKGRCDAERAAARQARDALDAFLGAGPVRLADITGDKYYGRVIADLVAADGRRASAHLIGSGLARPYQGRKRSSWCE